MENGLLHEKMCRGIADNGFRFRYIKRLWVIEIEMLAIWKVWFIVNDACGKETDLAVYINF